jgi:hypothetical protein
MDRMVERRAARPWPVSWSAIWLGAFAAVVAIVLFGFIGIAVGAQATGELSFKGTGLIALAWGVFAAFLAYVIGGWTASKIAGTISAEAGALHGAGAFLAGTMILLVLGALGAAFLGGWYGGFLPAATGQAPSAEAARNSAVAAAAAMLLGLVGSVIGGWMASGEGMDWSIATRRVGLERGVSE